MYITNANTCMRTAGGVTNKNSFMVERRKSSVGCGVVTPLPPRLEGLVGVVMTLAPGEDEYKVEPITNPGGNLSQCIFISECVCFLLLMIDYLIFIVVCQQPIKFFFIRTGLKRRSIMI